MLYFCFYKLFKIKYFPTPHKLNSNYNDFGESLKEESLIENSDIMKLLWGQILYCNLVLEQKVTESALLALSRDILLNRGALPVGEIG